MLSETWLNSFLASYVADAGASLMLRKKALGESIGLEYCSLIRAVHDGTSLFHPAFGQPHFQGEG